VSISWFIHDTAETDDRPEMSGEDILKREG